MYNVNLAMQSADSKVPSWKKMAHSQSKRGAEVSSVAVQSVKSLFVELARRCGHSRLARKSQRATLRPCAKEGSTRNKRTRRFHRSQAKRHDKKAPYLFEFAPECRSIRQHHLSAPGALGPSQAKAAGKVHGWCQTDYRGKMDP